MKVERPDMTAEVASAESAIPPPEEPPFKHAFSWLVRMRDGRIVRVDGDRCDVTNGVLTFYGEARAELLLVAFSYGEWLHTARMDRETGKNIGYHIRRTGRPPSRNPR